MLFSGGSTYVGDCKAFGLIRRFRFDSIFENASIDNYILLIRSRNVNFVAARQQLKHELYQDK
jgi:hypothetical protein